MRILINRWAWTIAALLALLAGAGRLGAATYSDPTTGYSFDLPDDWIQISQSAVQKLFQRVTPPGTQASFRYVAAFQPRSHRTDFQYPYVFIQVTPYPNSSTIASVSESELKSLVAQISGLSINNVRKNLSSEVNAVLQNGSFSGAAYTTDPPGFSTQLKMQTRVGTVRETISGRIGKLYLVSINFSALDGSDAATDAARQEMLSSFQLTPDQQAPLSSSPQQKLINLGLIVVGIIAVVVLINQVFARR